MPVLLQDVSRVSIGAAPQTGIFGLNDRIGGVEGTVLMRRWENPSEVLRAIHEAVDDLNANRLPEGARIVGIYDRTDLVANTLRTIARTLTEALIIVVVVLSLDARECPRRPADGGDDSPVAVLRVRVHACGGDPGQSVEPRGDRFRHHRRRQSGDGPARAAATGGTGESDPRRSTVDETIRRAALEMQRPIFFSLLIIIAAYLPLFALERVERRLFTPMAYIVCFALSARCC